MKKVYLWMLGIALLATACNETSQTKTPKKPSIPTNEVTTDMKETPPVKEIAAAETPEKNPDFEALLAKYPVIELPAEFPQSNPEEGKKWVSRPMDSGHYSYLFGDGKISQGSDEEAFYAHQIALGSDASAIITYVMGDFAERLILSTHKAGGSMIDHVVLSMVSEEETFGYGSNIGSTKKIFQSKIISRYDEDLKKNVVDVDSEKEYQLGEDGSILKL